MSSFGAESEKKKKKKGATWGEVCGSWKKAAACALRGAHIPQLGPSGRGLSRT
jgi:hypothetical protein